MLAVHEGERCAPRQLHALQRCPLWQRHKVLKTKLDDSLQALVSQHHVSHRISLQMGVSGNSKIAVGPAAWPSACPPVVSNTSCCDVK
jgi:hypothetical protein